MENVGSDPKKVDKVIREKSSCLHSQHGGFFEVTWNQTSEFGQPINISKDLIVLKLALTIRNLYQG